MEENKPETDLSYQITYRHYASGKNLVQCCVKRSFYYSGPNSEMEITLNESFNNNINAWKYISFYTHFQVYVLRYFDEEV